MKLQDFVGVEQRITKSSFFIPDDRDVPCFKDDRKEDCLGDGKGRSFEKSFDPEVTQALHALFRPFDTYFAQRILNRTPFYWSFGLNNSLS